MRKNQNKLFALVVLIALMSFRPMPQGKILFFGDSITEQGAKKGGYIDLLDSLVSRRAPVPPQFIGSGIGGNKVYDLYLRLEDDVLAKKPDVVVIWIGVNDVWHKRTSGTGTDYAKFERFYQALIRKISASGAKMLLCTPAVVGEQKDYVNELDGDLNRYSALIRKIAIENNCSLLDLRQAFHDYIQQNNPENKDRGILTTDGVHLNALGNLFVAREMEKALDAIR